VDNAQTPHLACASAHSRSAGTSPDDHEHGVTPQEDIHNHGYRVVAYGIP